MKTMVTMISSLPPIIGLSPYTQSLISALSKSVRIEFLGFNHIYPSFLYPGKMLDPNAKIVQEHENLKIKNVLDWYNPLGWIIEAFKIKTEIIHAQWWSFPLAPIYLVILGINKLRKKRIILTIHNIKPHEKSLLKTFLNKSIFSLGDEYIVHTEKNKIQLTETVKNKKIHIIPHGLIIEKQQGIVKEDARKKYNIKSTNKILLCFGHIRDYKGVDTALEALALIKDPDIKLFIAGHCWENWDKYEKIIRKNSLEERIIKKIDFIPAEEIESIFKASDLVLLPYKYFDAQSGVGSLSLPFNIPMIVSNTGGLTDYVNDPNAIVAPNNPGQLANKINKILNNENLYKKLINDSIKIKNMFSWQEIAAKTEMVYTNSISNTKKEA